MNYYQSTITTLIGDLFTISSEKGICLLLFEDDPSLEYEIKKQFKEIEIVHDRNYHIKNLNKEFDNYFSGNLKTFQTPLDANGTDFQCKVWTEIKMIPYGETSSYKIISDDLNHPKSIRAIGRANGANKILFLIPCHRVIGSDGKLIGYRGGLQRKQWLLDFEKRISGNEKEPMLFG